MRMAAGFRGRVGLGWVVGSAMAASLACVMAVHAEDETGAGATVGVVDGEDAPLKSDREAENYFETHFAAPEPTGELKNGKWHDAYDDIIFDAIDTLERQSISKKKSGEQTVKKLGDTVSSILLTSSNGLQAGEIYCSKYRKLKTSQKKLFWAKIMEAISHSETMHDRYSRYREPGMRDVETGRQTYSEGLIQASYADRLYYGCDRIDWRKDKSKSAKDPSKTIFDARANLECGVRILAAQIKNKGAITVQSGSYWAVLMKAKKHRQGYKRFRAAWENIKKRGAVNFCGNS